MMMQVINLSKNLRRGPAYVVLMSLFCVAGVIVSCNRGNDYPVKYTRQEFTGGEVIMHTSSGVVNDQVKKEQLIARIRGFYAGMPGQTGEPYSFDDDGEIYGSFDMEITMLSDTRGEIRSKQPGSATDDVIRFNLVPDGDFLRFDLHDTISTTRYGEDPVFRGKPLIVARIPVPMGDEIVKYLRPVYARKFKDRLELGVISYMFITYHNTDPGTFTTLGLTAAMNNFISDDYLDALTATGRTTTDTIVYKQSHIVFRPE